MNLFESFFGQSGQEPARRGSIPGKPGREAARHITDPRAREREIREMLQAIDLDDPNRRLSDEQVQVLNIPGVIQYACEELRYPLVMDQDFSTLDSDLACIISVLAEAIREGHEMTAEWSCKALTFAIRNLRSEISLVDESYAEEMMKCRVEYSQNLKLLVELCRECDFLNDALNDRRARRREKRKELDQAKNRYLSRRENGALDAALAELQQGVLNPASLSEEAMELRSELLRLHQLKAAVIELDIAIDADQVSLYSRESQLESRRNALSSAPHARDPRLQERINEADRIYREKLRRELDEAEEAIRLYSQHTEAMTDLAGISVHLTNTSRALEERKQMDMERLEQMLRDPQS